MRHGVVDEWIEVEGSKNTKGRGNDRTVGRATNCGRVDTVGSGCGDGTIGGGSSGAGALAHGVGVNDWTSTRPIAFVNPPSPRIGLDADVRSALQRNTQASISPSKAPSP